jgi:hypothetical protein
MKPFRVIEDWRSKHFGLPTRPPVRSAPSDEMLAVREMEARRQEADERFRAEVVAHARHLAEAERAARDRARVEIWRDLVARYGAATVEELARRTDPGFSLPDALRDERSE